MRIKVYENGKLKEDTNKGLNKKIKATHLPSKQKSAIFNYIEEEMLKSISKK